MAIQELCTVVHSKKLGEGLFSLTLDAPRIAALAHAGQFVHITCGEGNLLRRPISVCDVQGDSLRVVFQVKGEGTAWLSARKEGDALDVLGALGHGYELSMLGERPVFVGGGIGVPPMLLAMRAARAQGKQPTAILGFRGRGAVILEEEFRANGTVFVATDDGSYGAHGFVTDLLREHAQEYTSICACGPRPMLRAIAALAEQTELPCQVSLEERMGCGIGACLVCACELKLHDGAQGVRYGHVCKDGPVFDAKEVVW